MAKEAAHRAWEEVLKAEIEQVAKLRVAWVVEQAEIEQAAKEQAKKWAKQANQEVVADSMADLKAVVVRADGGAVEVDGMMARTKGVVLY